MVIELALCTDMKLFFFEWHEKDFHCGKINFTCVFPFHHKILYEHKSLLLEKVQQHL